MDPSPWQWISPLTTVYHCCRYALKRKGWWRWLWCSGEAATSSGGRISNGHRADSGWLPVGRFLHTDPDLELRWRERNFPPTRPQIPDNSLVIAVFRRCCKTEATVSREKHTSSCTESLRVTAKTGNKAGCWLNSHTQKPKVPWKN